MRLKIELRIPIKSQSKRLVDSAPEDRMFGKIQQTSEVCVH